LRAGVVGAPKRIGAGIAVLRGAAPGAEVLAGGLALAVIVAVVLNEFLTPGRTPLPGPWVAAMFGVTVGLAGVLGDLVESLIKRSAGVKDSSGLLPGHGGVLDRIDALLPTLPLAMMLLSLSP
jgi:CDP-diglyceride synthetase